MAVPVAIASLAATVIGAGVSAYGSYQQGQSQNAMYQYQSRVAQINANIAQNNANYETVAGGIQAQVSGTKTADVVGQTRAGIAAGGLDTGSGSAKDVISSEEEVGQFEQGTIRNDAARKAYGFQVAQFGDVAQSNLDVAAGQGAETAGDIGTYSSILGGASSVSDKWLKYGSAGAGILV